MPTPHRLSEYAIVCQRLFVLTEFFFLKPTDQKKSSDVTSFFDVKKIDKVQCTCFLFRFTITIMYVTTWISFILFSYSEIVRLYCTRIFALREEMLFTYFREMAR